MTALITAAVVFGTRPEAIKMAPVVLKLKRDERIAARTIVTAQHREMLDQVLDLFSVKPDIDLGLMRPDQRLAAFMSRALTALTKTFESDRPDIVVVHGDTSTTLAASLAAFYLNIPVGHVEAGLRVTDKFRPFPEEINRRLVDQMATIYFAPTKRATENLKGSGVPKDAVYLTGNTVVDAVSIILRSKVSFTTPEAKAWVKARGFKILLTAHRRESFGAVLDGICDAVLRTLANQPDAHVLASVHRNPRVRKAMHSALSGHPRVTLISPPPYGEFVRLMKHASLILTDSGGIQEEAPALGKYVLVLRKETERPEAVEAGFAKVIGTEPDVIVREATAARNHVESGRVPTLSANPFGDGRASQRIRQAILHHFGLAKEPPKDFAVR
jgi:UDP-N-acetylglucosamine 2-epimerase